MHSSITCSSSSLEPRSATMEWSSGMTIFSWASAPPRRPRDRLTYLPRPLPRPGARPGPMPAMLAARRATSRPAFRADARSPPADTGPGAASISRLTRWPVKRAPAKDVRMHVRHGLARLRAGVEDHAVPGVSDSLACRHLVRLCRELVQQPVPGGRDRREVRVVLSRYHQHVNRRLRVNVAKCNSSLGFEYPHRWDIARNDAAEQAIGHGGDVSVRWSRGRGGYIVSP